MYFSIILSGIIKLVEKNSKQTPLSALENRLVPNLPCYTDSRRAASFLSLHFLALNAWLSQSHERQLGFCHLATITGFRSKAICNRQYLTTKRYHCSTSTATHPCLKHRSLGTEKQQKYLLKEVFTFHFSATRGTLSSPELPPSHHP